MGSPLLADRAAPGDVSHVVHGSRLRIGHVEEVPPADPFHQEVPRVPVLLVVGEVSAGRGEMGRDRPVGRDGEGAEIRRKRNGEVRKAGHTAPVRCNCSCRSGVSDCESADACSIRRASNGCFGSGRKAAWSSTKSSPLVPDLPRVPLRVLRHSAQTTASGAVSRIDANGGASRRKGRACHRQFHRQRGVSKYVM